MEPAPSPPSPPDPVFAAPAAPEPPPEPAADAPAPPVEVPASAADVLLSSATDPIAAPPLLAPEAPPPLAPAEPPVLPAKPPAAFVFHGTAREYFRIWIVNTLLSLLTSGVFVAWAKVRKRRYLRGNTELLGHRFDYTANPRRILLGNVIIVVLFLAYALFGAVYPWVRFTALGVGALLLPWIVVRSLAFNAHHTVYRGLRFHFHPSLSPAVLLYLLKPLLIPLTLGFYYPAWARAKQEFVVGRHRLGTGYFHLALRNGPFYRAYLIAGAAVVAWAFIAALSLGLFVKSHGGRAPSMLQWAPFFLSYGAIFYLAKHFLFAQFFNLTWNATRLDNSQFHAQLHTGRWLGLQFTNLLAIVGSAGLLYPWAVVRSARYALSCFAFVPAEDFERIARMGEHDGSAVGDTAAEFVGLDFGL